MSFLSDKLAQTLADALNGSEKAQLALQQQGRNDLILLHDALRYDDDASLDALHENGHDDLGLFVAAVDGDPWAIQSLFDMKQARLAMCAGMVTGDEKSEQYLRKNGLKQWINLAEAVAKCLEDEA